MAAWERVAIFLSGTVVVVVAVAGIITTKALRDQ